MKNFKFNVLALGTAIFVLFTFSCASTGSSSQDGTFNVAVKTHNEAAQRMQQYGDTDAKVIELYNKAIDEYKKCITVNNKNTGEAYNYLGRMLNTGPRSLRNYEEALLYLYEAVDIYEKEEKEGLFLPNCYSEIGAALFRLGDYYSASENWKKAAELSDYYAGDESQLYWLGLGVEQDLSKSLEMNRKAAMAGRWECWANIYILEYQINEYSKGDFDNEGMTLFMDYYYLVAMGAPKDELISKLTQAADLDYTPAQYDLYFHLLSNNEFSKGMPYLKKAADKNYMMALYSMGAVYHYDLEKIKNRYQEAQKWYEKAATEGNPLAQTNLGTLYFNNQIKADNGFSNKEMAYYWWSAAADQGILGAADNLKIIGDYRTKFQHFVGVVKSVAGIVKTSVDTYKSLNKSNLQSSSYVPPNIRPTEQNRSSQTPQNTMGQPCPMKCNKGECTYNYNLNYCHGTGKIDCVVCRGAGYSDDKLCNSCKGEKKVQCGLCHGDGKCRRCRGTGRI